MQSCNIYAYLQLLSLALLAYIELAVGAEEEVSVTIGNIAPLSCFLSGQLPYDRPVSWYWTPLYPECSGSNGGKVLDIYPDGRAVFEEEFKGRVLVYRSKVKKGDYSITLRGVKIPDSGEFICTHDDLSEEKKVRLIVKTGCWSNLHLTVDPPIVSAGDKVTLTCTYCGPKVLTPRIKWQYDGLSISDTGVVSITNDGQSLVISRVDQEHLKKYGCSLARKESVVSEICLDIELDFLDTTTFAGDYDYPVSTTIPVITSESTTSLTTQEITTQVITTAATTNTSQVMWNDLEWMQDTSPETASLRTENYPTTIRSTVKMEETSDPWNEDMNQDQLGSAGKDCPVVVANGTSHLPIYMCIILGGILLLLIITFLIKRFKGYCKYGTHDVERNASDPNNRDSSGSEGMPPESQDESLVQTGNEDGGTAVTVDGTNEEMHEPKDDDEDTTESEVKEIDVSDSSHAKESEDVDSQDEDQE
ncbi:uncharacterized protein LOC121284344 [Carcharodon carcharias]|uniref:uncharacterized protein LOC121284344 n=1 Tax=Carcharodon carcharias TaxID=13397 RepID=UPI001B7DFBE2|nr:uncharacterized protein LOC121284344 [Carcharodon carcharias]